MVKDANARIINKERWGDYCLLKLESPAIASEVQPGQFIMVRTTFHPYPLLRRPFSVHASDGKHIAIFFQKTGLGTSLLIERNTNDTLDILGPLGKGFSVDTDFNGRTAAVLGGGRGIAPLLFLVQKLLAKGISVKVFYGGKTFADLPLKEKLAQMEAELLCSTDDGSFGYHGLVTDLFQSELKKFHPDLIYACGPEAMLVKTAKIAGEKNIPAEFSLESTMGCGFGACWGCVRRIKKEKGKEWVKVCEDGPVFSSHAIIWNEEEK